LESDHSSLGFDVDSGGKVLAARNRSKVAPTHRTFYSDGGDVHGGNRRTSRVLEERTRGGDCEQVKGGSSRRRKGGNGRGVFSIPCAPPPGREGQRQAALPGQGDATVVVS
jgi:hypothetical protein